jgi:probable F420-dependent oxidoreductase
VSTAASFPRIALLYFATDRSLPIVEFARAAEQRGFDGIVLPEHTHIPTASESPYPDGRPLPERYRHILDPFIALTAVAAQTGLNLGTCVSLVAQHDPIALAKTIATLDHLSGGRFTLGVGFGWNRAELANHGRDITRRRAIVREYVAAMRVLWRDDEAKFHGEHVSVSPSWSWPKPSRPQSVPVLLGCAPTPRGFNEIVSWADGWIPTGGDPDLLKAWLTSLRRQWLDAGRDQRGPVIWPMQTPVDDDTLRKNLDRFHALGVDQIVLDVQGVEGEDLLPLLDRYAAVLTRA